VSELPELWKASTPEPAHLFGRPPAFGLARDAGLLPSEIPPAPEPAAPPEPRRERGPFVTYLCLPWSYGDGGPADFWHRMRCRLGRHSIGGGDLMQVGGEVVFIERRCRWCNLAADDLTRSPR
jgi:hypothetical protein